MKSDYLSHIRQAFPNLDLKDVIVRRGVCEFVSVPSANPRQPDLNASLNRLAWAKRYTGEAMARELVYSGEIGTNENADAVVQFLELFDPYDPYDPTDYSAIQGVE